MASPLIDNMIRQHGIPVLHEKNVDTFVAVEEYSVLFFTGDPERVRESDDVAMILPELLAAFGGRMKAAVVDRDIERALQARYRVTAWPTLVFLRQGEYLGAISRVQDGQDYLTSTETILNAEPSDPPPFNLKDACAAA